MAATLLADLQRLQAEYVNYKKRVDRDREVIRHTAVGSVVESLLPVLDDIHMARQAGDLAGGPFAAIADKLESTLGRYGVERLGEAGQEFDPNVHEALMHVEAELPEGATGTTVVRCSSRATASATGSSGPRGCRLPTLPETSAAGLPAQPGGIPDDGSSVRVTVKEEVRHG